jgi:hypothetical protein
MTQQQALKILGLTALPSGSKALSSIFAKANCAAATRLQYDSTRRNEIIEEMARLKEAYQFLLNLVSPQPGPVPPRPVPVPPKPRPAPAPPGPIPAPPWPVPVPPKPVPVPSKPRPAPSIWPWLKALGTLALLALLGLGLALKYSMAALRFIFSRIPAEVLAIAAIVMVCAGAVFSGWWWFTRSTAEIRPLTWPVADVYIDGRYLVEGPSPSYATVPSGRRQVRFVPRNGAAYETSLWFMPRARYEVRVNLYEKTLEKIKKD